MGVPRPSWSIPHAGLPRPLRAGRPRRVVAMSPPGLQSTPPGLPFPAARRCRRRWGFPVERRSNERRAPRHPTLASPAGPFGPERALRALTATLTAWPTALRNVSKPLSPKCPPVERQSNDNGSMSANARSGQPARRGRPMLRQRPRNVGRTTVLCGQRGTWHLMREFHRWRRSALSSV
jgi:hypothetical protein